VVQNGRPPYSPDLAPTAIPPRRTTNCHQNIFRALKGIENKNLTAELNAVSLGAFEDYFVGNF
jgi:hypothetical protein